MRTLLGRIILLLLLAASQQGLILHAQGTAFTYQGRLNSGGGLANGSYDFQFTLFTTNVTGTALAGPVTNAAVAVTNGLFTTLVNFGPGAFTGTSNWLAIAVSTNGANSFSVLAPRQQVTPTPYAINAANAGTAAAVSGNVPVGQLTGVIPAAQLPASVVTNGASGINLTGTFSGNGAGVTNLNFPLNFGGMVTVVSNNYLLASLLNTGDPSSAPVAVVAADVNGDGKPDLICVNSTANNGTSPTGTLMVWTNDGSGGFGSNATLNVGPLPSSVVAVDVNNDGYMDLVCANSDDSGYTVGSYLSIFKGSSTGFTLSSNPGVGRGCRSIVAADVNGDGRVDLITANGAAGTLTVLTNLVGSIYGSNATLNAGSGSSSTPVSLVAVDVNGDGKVDLICANAFDNTLTVFTNNGSGRFVTATNLNVGVSPDSVAAADVNGDGKVDLICANYNDNTLTVLTNNGTGRFTQAALLGVGNFPRAVIAADMNGDGKVDLICANGGDNALTILTNNGTGRFGWYASPSVGFTPTAVAAADLNGDGKLDLISVNYGVGTLSVLFNMTALRSTFIGNGNGLVNIPPTAIAGGITTNVLVGTKTLYFVNGVLVEMQ